MPNPAGVQYRLGRDTRCPSCGLAKGHPFCRGVCTTCGASFTDHPKCEACGIFVGKGHEAEETQEALYAPISSAATSVRFITRGKAVRMPLCPSCYKAAVAQQEERDQGAPVTAEGCLVSRRQHYCMDCEVQVSHGAKRCRGCAQQERRKAQEVKG